jgi:hypothetical protein
MLGSNATSNQVWGLTRPTKNGLQALNAALTAPAGRTWTTAPTPPTCAAVYAMTAENTSDSGCFRRPEQEDSK